VRLQGLDRGEPVEGAGSPERSLPRGADPGRFQGGDLRPAAGGYPRRCLLRLLPHACNDYVDA
jgi:hypothetical protein